MNISLTLITKFIILLGLHAMCAWAQSDLTNKDKRQANTLYIAGQDIPPFFYMNDDKKIDGSFYKLTKSICESEKISCNFYILPFRRLQKYLQRGEVHISLPMAISKEREAIYNFSDIIHESKYVFFGKTAVSANIKTLKDIKQEVGVHSPSSTFNSLLKLKKEQNLDLVIVEETDVSHVFDKLTAGRYPLIFMNKDIVKHWVLKEKNTEYSYFENFENPISYRAAYTKDPKDQNLIKKFNEGLKKYINSKKVLSFF